MAFGTTLAIVSCRYIICGNIAEFKVIIVLAGVYSIIIGFGFEYLYLVYNISLIELIYKINRVDPYN